MHKEKILKLFREQVGGPTSTDVTVQSGTAKPVKQRHVTGGKHGQAHISGERARAFAHKKKLGGRKTLLDPKSPAEHNKEKSLRTSSNKEYIYNRMQSLIEDVLKKNSWSAQGICVDQVAHTAGTTERSKWGADAKARFEKCVKDIKNEG
jgi:hypothetical protein